MSKNQRAKMIARIRELFKKHGYSIYACSLTLTKLKNMSDTELANVCKLAIQNRFAEI